MLDTLFGDGNLAVKLVGGLIIVIGLIAAFFWGLRRFGGERLGAAGGRGRQPRLAVVDAAMVDGRRRLVLIRRDNVEHLLIIRCARRPRPTHCRARSRSAKATCGRCSPSLHHGNLQQESLRHENRRQEISFREIPLRESFHRVRNRRRASIRTTPDGSRTTLPASTNYPRGRRTPSLAMGRQGAP